MEFYKKKIFFYCIYKNEWNDLLSKKQSRAKDHYEKDKEKLREKARNKYRNLSEEDKSKRK